MNIDNLAVNTIRTLAMDAVEKARSGHPGMPMGCAPIAYTLYSKVMRHSPSNPSWLNRDRFILSAGHGSMLLYSTLHLTGYGITLDDIKNFRQWQSITPGHPEFGLTPGVETTTGPLGQGFGNAVGFAVAQEFLASKFNKPGYKIIDHYIYGICSDGDLMEGISYEAASLAGHLKLGKIIFFYDSNKISIDGSTDITFTEDVARRFEAANWHVIKVDDGNDTDKLQKAAKDAQKDPRPSLIITKTHIGYGSPNKQDKASSHGSPLGAEEIKLTKANLGWDYDEPFTIPEEVTKHFESLRECLDESEAIWNKIFENYKKKFPEEAESLLEYMKGNFDTSFFDEFDDFPADGKKIATRQASGKVIAKIADYYPTMLGGSADLAESNNTTIPGSPDFSSSDYSGRNFRYGVREHAMGNILHAMAMYGGVIPYGGTFLIFSDYMRPAIRLAALNKVSPVFVFTHDSIGLGEDGPTHQPVEQLMSLRAIPNTLVFRPADANETKYAWKYAVGHKSGPVILVLTRQGLPVLDRSVYPAASEVEKGAYILYDTNGEPDIILIASGSEVHVTLESAKELEAEGYSVRVVNMVCTRLYDLQSKNYQDQVLPPNVTCRVSVEAGISLGWERYVGLDGDSVAIDHFGASAPAEVLFEKYGFTTEHICEVAKRNYSRIND